MVCQGCSSRSFIAYIICLNDIVIKFRVPVAPLATNSYVAASYSRDTSKKLRELHCLHMGEIVLGFSFYDSKSTSAQDVSCSVSDGGSNWME